MDCLFKLIIGVFMVASTSFTAGLAEYGKGTHFLERHLLFLIIGMVAAGVGYVLPLKVFQHHIKHLRVRPQFQHRLGTSIVNIRCQHQT